MNYQQYQLDQSPGVFFHHDLQFGRKLSVTPNLLPHLLQPERAHGQPYLERSKFAPQGHLTRKNMQSKRAFNMMRNTSATRCPDIKGVIGPLLPCVNKTFIFQSIGRLGGKGQRTRVENTGTVDAHMPLSASARNQHQQVHIPDQILSPLLPMLTDQNTFQSNEPSPSVLIKAAPLCTPLKNSTGRLLFLQSRQSQLKVVY